MQRFRCLKGWVGFFPPLLPVQEGVLDLLLILFLLFFPGVLHAPPSAKRFKKQIFLSVDVPPEVYSSGQGPAVLLGVERGIVEQLRGM